MVTCISCSDQGETTQLECDKLESREEAQSLKGEESNDRLSDSIKIIDNLIGEWGSIGVIPGWFDFEVGRECLKLTIDADKIEIEDLNSGLRETVNWELRSFKVNSFSGFFIQANDYRIGMDLFSDDIMLGSGRIEDGDTYIYEKID